MMSVLPATDLLDIVNTLGSSLGKGGGTILFPCLVCKGTAREDCPDQSWFAAKTTMPTENCIRQLSEVD